MRKTLFPVLALLGLFVMACEPDSLPGDAAQQEIDTRSPAFPDVIPLPNGSGPEGIASGIGTTFYAGSLADGSIFQGDYRTGEVTTLFTPDEPRLAVGLDFDARSGYLFVAGGNTGSAFVIDTRTGTEVAAYSLGQGFINDVIVTHGAAYFTNSFAPEFYRLPIGPAGQLGRGDAEAVPLSGDYQFFPGNFNGNGVEAHFPPCSAPRPCDTIIIMNSANGTLYKVAATTGVATEIDLGGESLPNGDGILLRGKKLYVVQNFLNQVAVVELSPDGNSGEIVEVISSDDFRIPTTAAEFGSHIYVVNARFDVSPPGSNDPSIEFEVVKAPK